MWLFFVNPPKKTFEQKKINGPAEDGTGVSTESLLDR